MSFLPALGHHNHQKKFEIQLDDDTFSFLGKPSEAQAIEIKGRLVFCNRAASKVKYVRIGLIGKYQIRMNNRPRYREIVTSKGEFYRKELLLYNSELEGQPSNLPPSCHVWPFSFTVRGSELETFKGMADSFYSWKLEAKAVRQSFVKDHETKRSIHIIRTYDPTSRTLYAPVELHNIWEGKCRYTFSMPCRGVVYGSVAPYKLTLIPLIKGLKINRMETHLIEGHEWHFNTNKNGIFPKEPQFKERTIAWDNAFFLQDREMQNINGADGFVIERQILLPKNLKACKLSMDPELPSGVNPIHTVLYIKHHLVITVYLINPGDGHISTLKATLRVTLFIRPNQKFDKDFNLLNSGVIPMVSNPDIVSTEFSAPPRYGQHSADETLDARDPMNSGFTTPTGLLSSRASAVDMVELYNQDQPSGRVIAGAFHEIFDRLSFLSRSIGIAGPSESAAQDIQSLVAPLSEVPQSTGELSPPPEDEENDHSIPLPTIPELSSSSADPFFPSSEGAEHIEYDNRALVRLPSYNTAAQQAEPPANSRAGLPEYDEDADPSSQTEQPAAPRRRTRLPSSSSAFGHALG